MHMVMTSDEIQIKMFADWSMSHAKRVTLDNRQKSRILLRCRGKDISVPQKIHGQTMLRLNSISDLKSPMAQKQKKNTRYK